MIYSDKEIAENELYADIMIEINEIYEEMGSPDQFEEGASDRTTGEPITQYWATRDIGDWGGNECAVAEYANDCLDIVFSGLGLMGNGGIRHIDLTIDWELFLIEATDLIEDFHNRSAFDRLCSLEIKLK